MLPDFRCWHLTDAPYGLTMSVDRSEADPKPHLE